MVYPEPWHIQNPNHIHNPGICRTLAYSKSEAYLEPCQTSIMKRFAKIVNGNNYFHELCFAVQACRVLYFMKYDFLFNTGLIFTSDVVILCKTLWRPRGQETVNFLYTY